MQKGPRGFNKSLANLNLACPAWEFDYEDIRHHIRRIPDIASSSLKLLGSLWRCALGEQEQNLKPINT
jgi:hypothetical protein